MKSSKDKAIELRDSFYSEINADGVGDSTETYRAKERAMTCVDEIVKAMLIHDCCITESDKKCYKANYIYWHEVKAYLDEL